MWYDDFYKIRQMSKSKKEAWTQRNEPLSPRPRLRKKLHKCGSSKMLLAGWWNH